MNPEKVKKALDAIKNGDTEAALALLEEMIADAAAGGAASTDPAAAAQDASAPAADQPPPSPDAEMAALGRMACLITGSKDAGVALLTLRELHANSQLAAKEAAANAVRERNALVAELVVCGAEFPATAWERDASGAIPEGDARRPVKRLADESLDSLRERVKLLKASRASGGGFRPPTTGESVEGRTFKTSKGEIQLSAREIKNCESQGADVNAYAENKAIREAAKHGRN